MVRFHPGSLTNNWSVGAVVARVLGKDEARIRLPNGPLDCGLMVQREDSNSADWRSNWHPCQSVPGSIPGGSTRERKVSELAEEAAC